MASDNSSAGAYRRSFRLFGALTLATLLTGPLAALADEQRTYVWRDRDGTVRFTASPPIQQVAKPEAVDSKAPANPKEQVGKL